MSPRALITGYPGQDASYMAQHLDGLGYEVFATYRGYQVPLRGAEAEAHIDAVLPMDLLDPVSISTVLKRVQPDEIYNFAGQSHAGLSSDQPLHTFDVNTKGPLHLFLAAARICPNVRIYQASSSEMYGYCANGRPLTMRGKMEPENPYGVSKLSAHHMARIYRDTMGLYIACGIAFNHESPLRPEQFVTRKIAKAAAARKPVSLGNINAMRDWGWAPEYVVAMHLLLQQPVPLDTVLATGEAVSVYNFAIAAYEAAGLNAIDYVKSDPALLRAKDDAYLLGDPDQAGRLLGWRAETKGRDVARAMVEAESRVEVTV